MIFDLAPGNFRRAAIVVSMITLALSVLVPWAPPSFAQSRDQRLSPVRFVADIAPDMEIQAAARVGDRTLVVWGSSRRGADSALQGALWYQFVEAGEGVGSPQVVPEATPSGFVSVIPVHDRFVIVWNESRNSTPTLVCRLVDREGVLSEAVLLWSGGISDAGVSAIQTADGYRLLWSGKQGSVLHARRFDLNGIPVGDVEELGQFAAGRFIEPAALPGYRIIERHGALPLVYDDHGNEHPLGTAAAKLRSPYAIGSDGSVATITADTIRLYRSILDIMPADSTIVSYHSDWIRGSSMVQFDSLGRIVVLYATGGGAASGRAERVYISIHAVRTTGVDSLVFASRYLHSQHTIAAPSLDCEYFTLRTGTPAVVQGIAGHYLLRVPVEGSRVSTCLGEPVVEAIDTIEEIFVGRGNEPLGTTLPVSRPAPVGLPVKRLNRSLQSIVMVELAEDSIILSAPSAERLDSRTERVPGIAVIDGRPMVGWLSGGADTLGMLGEWNMATSGIALRTPVDVGVLSDDREFRNPPASVTSFRSFGGGFAMVTDVTWSQAGVPGEQARYRRHYSITLPTRHGWRSVIDIDTADAALRPNLYGAAHDFDNDETVLAWSLSARELPVTANRMSINAYDTGARYTWSLDSLPLGIRSPFWILPIAPGEFVFASLAASPFPFSRRFARFRDGELIDEGAIDDLRYGTLVNLRLPYALSYNAVGVYMDLVLYDLEGEILARTTSMPRRTMPNQIFVLQDPVDSTIILLWGGRGVSMARYDLSLNQIGEDRIISDTRDSVRNPAAIIHGDSLFVVWEDYRDTTSAIYGTGIQLRDLSGIDNVAPIVSPAAITFSPNPASRRGTIGFPYPAGDDATVEIVDALGRVQSRIPVPPGARSLTIPTNHLAPGFFLARLIDGERIGSVTFMVMR